MTAHTETEAIGISSGGVRMIPVLRSCQLLSTEGSPLHPNMTSTYTQQHACAYISPTGVDSANAGLHHPAEGVPPSAGSLPKPRMLQ